MKLPLLHSLPLLLLVALACRAAPVHAQSTAVVERTLPHADLGASLRTLAGQAPTLASTLVPGIKRALPKTPMPLRLLPPPANDRARAALTARIGVGGPPYSALQAGAAVPPMQRVNTGGTLVNIEGIASDRTVAPADPNGAVGES
ncbi:MAG: hypothetical protein JWR40_626 [Massilia sp.]|nr:hypothetical protein [Massilia sp.]MDB5950549.1 hypothetical protein [Massilia sp.]